MTNTWANESKVKQQPAGCHA